MNRDQQIRGILDDLAELGVTPPELQDHIARREVAIEADNVLYREEMGRVWALNHPCTDDWCMANGEHGGCEDCR